MVGYMSHCRSKILPRTNYLHLTCSIHHFLTSNGILKDKTLKMIHRKIHLMNLRYKSWFYSYNCHSHTNRLDNLRKEGSK